MAKRTPEDKEDERRHSMAPAKGELCMTTACIPSEHCSYCKAGHKRTRSSWFSSKAGKTIRFMHHVPQQGFVSCEDQKDPWNGKDIIWKPGTKPPVV